MNIDEARTLIKEADALKDLRAWLGAKADNATSFPIPEAAFPYLAPLLDARVREIDAQFNPQPAAAATLPPFEPTTPGRPKVKPAVAEAFRETKDDSEAAWKKWAETAGFKWGSVANVLRELRAERDAKLKAERLKDPLNAGVAAAMENLASLHDADIQKDTFVKLATGG